MTADEDDDALVESMLEDAAVFLRLEAQERRLAAVEDGVRDLQMRHDGQED